MFLSFISIFVLFCVSDRFGQHYFCTCCLHFLLYIIYIYILLARDSNNSFQTWFLSQTPSQTSSRSTAALIFIGNLNNDTDELKWGQSLFDSNMYSKSLLVFFLFHSLWLLVSSFNWLDLFTYSFLHFFCAKGHARQTSRFLNPSKMHTTIYPINRLSLHKWLSKIKSLNNFPPKISKTCRTDHGTIIIIVFVESLSAQS